jgi:hypothetical protein
MLRIATLGFALLGLPLVAGAGDDKADTGKVRQQLIDLTNKQRATGRIPAVKLNVTLMSVAQKHAEDMAAREIVTHNLNGKGSKERAKEAGYPGVVGENVFGSKRTGAGEAAEDAIRWWMTSPGHRANIIAKDFTEMGTGMARSRSGRWYLCQVFGVPTASGVTKYARVLNKTGGTIRVEVKNAAKPQVVPDGTGFAVPVALPKEGLEMRLLPPDAGGTPIPFTLHNGDSYVITKDGKGYKVQKEK